jgi:hypothetical protein
MQESARDEISAQASATNRDWIGKHYQIPHNLRVIGDLKSHSLTYAGDQSGALQLFVFAAQNTASELRLRQGFRSCAEEE